MTFCDFPLWTINGLLPHGTAAIYAPHVVREQFISQIEEAVFTGDDFLGFAPVRGDVLVVGSDSKKVTLAALEAMLSSKAYGLVIINPLGVFRIDTSARKTRHEDYFQLNKIAFDFKVCILVVPEKRTDAIDYALDTLITFEIPDTADEEAPYRFKVESRDTPPIHGQAVINPASGLLEAVL